MTESGDNVIREFLAALDRQKGVYVDAMAGFAGHEVRISNQSARIVQRSGTTMGPDGKPQVMMASYEDPTRPDVIISRIVRVDEYLSDNSPLGFNAQYLAHAFIVFIFAMWEHEYRPRFARSMNIETNSVTSNIFGDLREIRHDILHHKAVLRSSTLPKLRVLKNDFSPTAPIVITVALMEKILTLIHQGCFSLLVEFGCVPNPPCDVSSMRGFAILKREN